jgi:serine/threonine protein kinase/alpha-tubulin suppressor-like RCC1 family protein
VTLPGERENLPRFAELDADYEILRELGRGGTAVVYLALERMLNRHVAIKVIRTTYVEDEEASARLMREARTVGRLLHPNIVVLYGTRRLGDGSLALIMQYVPGRTLRQEIQASGGLSFDRVHSVLTDVARALAFAHRQRIVHRDVKPENIYVDDDGVARLADFGIARSWGAESDLTLPGMAIGTPAYMSPEQIDGGEIDGRSDLYSLGLVGYELVTGAKAWSGEGLYSIIAKQKNEALPALDERRPGIPPALQLAIEGAVRKQRDARWQTADEFLVALGSAPEVERAEPPASPFAELLSIESPLESATAPAAAAVPVPAGSPQNDETVVWRPPAPPVETTAAEPAVVPPRRHPRRPALIGATVALVALTGATLLATTLRRAPELRTDTSVAAQRAPAADSTVQQADAASGGAGEMADAAAGPDAAANADSTPALPPTRAALVYAVFGDGQHATAGSVLPKPLMVRVVDAAGSAVEGATVRFAVTTGEGSVQPTVGTTNQDGVAATRWLPQTVGVHRAQARVDGLPGVLEFRANALPATVLAARGSSPAERPEQIRNFSPVQRDSLPYTARQPDVASAPAAGGTNWPLRVRREVAAGGSHTCSLSGDGTARCWGAGDAGQLGGRAASGPGDQLRVALDEPLATVAAGAAHTCAVSVSGSAFCWGGNTSGQLGDGTRVSRPQPARVRLPDRVTAITLGASHSCALDATGRVSCWGSNERGQLGDRTTSDRSLAVRVAGRHAFRSVVAGWTHTCALTLEGAAYCWGSNRFGELGDGGNQNRAEPVAVAGGHRFVAIAAGNRFTCGVRADGAGLCWGENAHGQLGNGSTASSSRPLEILAADRFVTIAAGGAHACAVSWDGSTFCWGQNSQGQLGDGSVSDRLTPSAVAGGYRFGALTANASHTCGTAASGRSYCWGSNEEGQLGGGPRTVQTRAAALTNVPGDD